MIGAIVVTAVSTAAVCIVLMHRRNSYTYSVEQTALERAGQIETLTEELLGNHARIRELNRALTKAIVDGNGAKVELAEYRAREYKWEREALAATISAAIDAAPPYTGMEPR